MSVPPSVCSWLSVSGSGSASLSSHSSGWVYKSWVSTTVLCGCWDEHAADCELPGC